MRIAGTCIILIGVFLLTGATFAQSPDEAQSSGEEHGESFQAPGVHVWIGQTPSKEELQALFSEVRANAPSQRALGQLAPAGNRKRRHGGGH